MHIHKNQQVKNIDENTSKPKIDRATTIVFSPVSNVPIPKVKIETTQTTNKSIFPSKPNQGLIHSIIHLFQCTYILITYYLGLHSVPIALKADEQKESALKTEQLPYLQITRKSIFPPKPERGLIISIIYVFQCTYIMLTNLVSPHSSIPVIHMTGTYQSPTTK